MAVESKLNRSCNHRMSELMAVITSGTIKTGSRASSASTPFADE